MKARIQWTGQAGFIGESDSGHSVVMDGPPEFGGNNLGIRPMEMLLLGMGGCMAFDIVMILQKARQSIHGCVAELDAERADSLPKVFTRIHSRFLLSGTDLKPEQIERAIHLSHEKYCSASIMLGQTAELTHEWKIVEACAAGNLVTGTDAD